MLRQTNHSANPERLAKRGRTYWKRIENSLCQFNYLDRQAAKKEVKWRRTFYVNMYRYCAAGL